MIWNSRSATFAHHRWQTCYVILFTIGSFANGILKAAPITLIFDAEITNVPTGSPFDLGINYQVGDIIQGRLVLEPGVGNPINDVGVGADQDFAFDLIVNGTALNTVGYEIVAFNDSTNFDSENGQLLDGLTVSCREVSCVPNLVTLPQGEPFRVRFDMQLVGNSSIWSVPEITGDTNVWNAFSVRRFMHVGFDNVGPGSMGFDAVVRQFTLVPEPSLLPIICCICSLFASGVRCEGVER